MLIKFGEQGAESDRSGEVEWYSCPPEVEVGGEMHPIKDIECSTEGKMRHRITEGEILGLPRIAHKSGMVYRYVIALNRLGTIEKNHHNHIMSVSRLIAMTVPIKKEFDDDSELYDADIHDQVHHLNGLAHDNHPQNLAWVSREENKWIHSYLTYKELCWRCDGTNVLTSVFENDSEDDSD